MKNASICWNWMKLSVKSLAFLQQIFPNSLAVTMQQFTKLKNSSLIITPIMKWAKKGFFAVLHLVFSIIFIKFKIKQSTESLLIKDQLQLMRIISITIFTTETLRHPYYLRRSRWSSLIRCSQENSILIPRCRVLCRNIWIRECSFVKLTRRCSSWTTIWMGDFKLCRAVSMWKSQGANKSGKWKMKKKSRKIMIDD